jgi:hypothetical protein
MRLETYPKRIISALIVAAPLVSACAGARPSWEPSLASDQAACWQEAVHRSSLDGSAIAQFRVREDLFERCMRARGWDGREAAEPPGS